MSAVLATTVLPANDDAILLQAEGIVRDFCGWDIAPVATVVHTVEHRGGRNLLLPSRFVTAVTSVTHNGLAVTGWRLTDAGVLTGSYFPCGPYVVVFTQGFAPEAVPPAVTRAVQAVAQRIKGRAAAGGLTSRQAGPFAESYGDDLLDEAERADLGPYRQMLA